MVRPYIVLLDGQDEASRSLEPADCPVVRLGVQKLLAPQAMRKLLEFRRFLMGERIDVLEVDFPGSTYSRLMPISEGYAAGARAYRIS
jgi:L-malate glycosyltransferase